jgi:hypothetical protein
MPFPVHFFLIGSGVRLSSIGLTTSGGLCENSTKVRRNRYARRKPELSDAEVRAILVQAMADVADPALVYAFLKDRRLRLRRKRKAASKEVAASV